MKNHDDKTKRTRIVYVSIFFLLVTGIAATGYVSYRNFERDFRRQAERQISAIAELKVKELMNWRKERLDDAEFLYHNPAFSALVERYFETPNDNEARAQLQAWLDDYQVYHQYDSVRLMDVTGTERLSISTPDLPDSHLTQDAIACLHSGEIAFSDFYRDTGVGDPIHLAVLVPIFADKNNNRPLGVLALGINPQTYLYPYIQSWPIPSDTAETLLVRREGEDVLFLNELRFEQDAALNLRLSLTNTDIPAVKAALGQTGVAEGMDYRGKPVLADVRAVPDSPWFLVSKMDTAEIYLPLRARLWQTLLISGMAIFVAGAGLMLILRQQRLLFYRMQAEKAEALHESEEKFKYVFDYSVVGKSITYLNGEIHVNKALCDMLGYSPQEMQDKKWQEITHPDDIELTQSNIDEIISGKKESARFVKRFIHKNGSIVWVDLSSTIRRDQHNQALYLMSTLMDITERKQVEEAHAKSEAMLKKVQEVTHMGSWAIDLNTKAVIASDEAHRIYGISQGLMTLDYIQSVPLPEFRPILDAALTALITEGKRYDVEFKIRRQSDGEVRDIHSIAEYNAQSQTIIGSVQDITDRKQAEEALKKSEIWFKSLFEKASDGIFYLSMDNEFVEVNDAFARMHGYSVEEMRKMKLSDLDTPETIRQFPERMRQVMGGEVLNSKLNIIIKMVM